MFGILRVPESFEIAGLGKTPAGPVRSCSLEK
jgi:hypothetical protein